MRGKLRSRGNGHATPLVEPAPERFRSDHVGGGVILRSPETIKDANGGIGRPWQVLDTLARMERRGSISKGYRAAGLYFHKIFIEAGLDPLWAADPTRLPVLTLNGRGGIARRGSAAAVELVMDSLARLGGPTSPGGSCAWSILGCEMTLESWALSRSFGTLRIDRRVATGILLTDLGILQTYYRLA